MYMDLAALYDRKGNDLDLGLHLQETDGYIELSDKDRSNLIMDGECVDVTAVDTGKETVTVVTEYDETVVFSFNDFRTACPGYVLD